MKPQAALFTSFVKLVTPPWEDGEFGGEMMCKGPVCEARLKRSSKGALNIHVCWLLHHNFWIHYCIFFSFLQKNLDACGFSVADLRGRSWRASLRPKIFTQFLIKFGKIVCWRPPGRLAPILREILDPPLQKFLLCFYPVSSLIPSCAGRWPKLKGSCFIF